MKHFALAAVLALTVCAMPRAVFADSLPGDHIASVAPEPNHINCAAPVSAEAALAEFAPTSATVLSAVLHARAIRPDKPSPTSKANSYLVPLGEPPAQIRCLTWPAAFRVSIIDGHFARPLARPHLS